MRVLSGLKNFQPSLQSDYQLGVFSERVSLPRTTLRLLISLLPLQQLHDEDRPLGMLSKQHQGRQCFETLDTEPTLSSNMNPPDLLDGGLWSFQ